MKKEVMLWKRVFGEFRGRKEEGEMIYHNLKNKRKNLEKLEKKFKIFISLFSAKEKENAAKKVVTKLGSTLCSVYSNSGRVIAPFPTGNISSQLFIILPSTLSFHSATHTGIHFSLFFPHLNIHLSLAVSPAQFCRKCLQFLTLQNCTALTVSFIY